uniref:Uncharacterized protein n=1 Tax=Solemoviridae sp. TaxID=2715208 RepID=A0A6M3YUQ6_9VIRU|nr:MAG: hypothetical protein 1 [Solemoviridae sp.]
MLVFYVELIVIAICMLSAAFVKSAVDKVALIISAVIVAAFVVQFTLVMIVEYGEELYAEIANTAHGLVSKVELMHVQTFMVCLAILVLLVICTRRGRTVTKAYSNTYTPHYAPERMIPGSSFELKAQMPDFQVEVHGSIDSVNYHPLGQAFWIDEGVVTAAHVIHDIDYVVLKRGEAEIFLEREDFAFLDGDLALYKISQQQTQKLGMRKAKLSPIAVQAKSGLMAQVVAFGQRSFGFLGNYDQFGYCVYGGSTVKGFSGAPYYLNKVVYGMHLGGSQENLGYEAAYIRSVLKPSKTIVANQEGSDDWLLEQAERGESFAYQRSPYDPDEYQVKLNGRYHMVDSDTFRSLQLRATAKPRAAIKYEFEANSVPAVRPLDVPESLTDTRPVQDKSTAEELPLCPRGAMNFKDQGNLMRAPAVIAGAHGPEVVRVTAQVHEPQISSPTVYKSQRPLERSHMESRPLMPAQQNAVSKSTARNRKRASENRLLRNTIEQLSNRLSRMERGQQISQEPTTSMHGSTTNSRQRSENLITTAPQGTVN